MGSTRISDAAMLPEHLRAAPIHVGEGEMPLRLCVVVRKQADPVGGQFVLLRDFADASVFLGCIVDAEQRIWDWVELWVQNAEKLPSFLPNFREKFSNDMLDERWSIAADALRELNPAVALKTGWETAHPQPIAIDVTSGKSMHPLNPETGKAWKLCKDDGLLRGAGLPAYSTSVCRYWCDATGAKPQFVPVSADAPDTATVPLSEAVPEKQVVFNPQAGLILARRFSPLGIDEYADALSGKPWKGAENARQPYVPRGVYAALQDPKQLQESGAYLFLGKQGAAGRLVEVFHLKVQLLAEAIRLARMFVQKQQLPLLNISAESFRVSLSETTAGLPFLWTAQVDLAKPSQAFALPVETSSARYFLPAKGTERSIYLPEGIGKSSRGEGTVRIRKLMPQDKSLVVVEGTLVTENKLEVSPNDLMWIRLPVGAGRVDLYGHIQPSDTAGEARFRTEAQRFSEATVAALKAAEGVSLSKVAYEFIPMLSSAVDLYSVGVLAVRLFLVNEGSTLPVAVDEVLNLARQAGAEAGGDLKQRIRGFYEKDSRWSESIGPHRLLWEKSDPKIAAQVLPMDLWWDLLANIARLFPGVSAHSVCRDLGDAPSLALESVFNAPLSNLELLGARTRSLIVIDWKFNREIHSVISGFLEKLPG